MIRKFSHIQFDISNYIIIAIVIFVISLILYKILIPFLYKLKFGQVVRDDGPETHLKKAGTPTMGGIVFSIVSTIISIIFIIGLFSNSLYSLHYNSIYMCFCMLFFALIGLIDDLRKVVYKDTKGLKSKYKMILQIIVAIIFIYSVYYNYLNINRLEKSINLFLMNKQLLFNGVNELLFIFIITFIIIGTDNGVNFTDGLDGLCSVVTIIVGIFYFILCVNNNEFELAIVNIAVIVSLLAFLIYNHYPAKLFMGDTGSLFLGAYVSMMAILLDIVVLLPIFGFIYMIEVISVIMQVSYFKITHGKRIFKMAPIHHHFEKSGMNENQIVIMFSIITIIGCIISYLIINGGIYG